MILPPLFSFGGEVCFLPPQSKLEKLWGGHLRSIMCVLWNSVDWYLDSGQLFRLYTVQLQGLPFTEMTMFTVCTSTLGGPRCLTPGQANHYAWSCSDVTALGTSCTLTGNGTRRWKVFCLFVCIHVRELAWGLPKEDCQKKRPSRGLLKWEPEGSVWALEVRGPRRYRSRRGVSSGNFTGEDAHERVKPWTPTSSEQHGQVAEAPSTEDWALSWAPCPGPDPWGWKGSWGGKTPTYPNGSCAPLPRPAPRASWPKPGFGPERGKIWNLVIILNI